MKSQIIYQGPQHAWHMLGRDAEKPAKIIDTNQYVIRTANRAIILDPGGIELFSPMLAGVLRIAPVEQITDLFASHQDPDIISSLGLWDQALPKASLHSPWLWEGFIRHFGMDNIQFKPIADDGGEMEMDGMRFQFIPAHYLHSSGNHHVYDPQAKILFSGDIGAALERIDAPMFVDDFDSHVRHMQMFHQRWMPSNTAKNAWVQRVRRLEIDMMCPQHGRIFKGDDVKRFLDWFERLEVGIAVK